MESLNIQTVTTIFNSPPTHYQSSGVYTMQVPQSSVNIAKPLSYEFRVAEYVNEEGVVKKVGLQYSVFEHDNHGVRQLRQSWKDVERVRLPYTE